MSHLIMTDFPDMQFIDSHWLREMADDIWQSAPENERTLEAILEDMLAHKKLLEGPPIMGNYDGYQPTKAEVIAAQKGSLDDLMEEIVEVERAIEKKNKHLQITEAKQQYLDDTGFLPGK